MKRTKSIYLALLAVVLSPMAANADLFVIDLADGVNALPIPGNQAYEGQLGDDFTTTSDISLTAIGVFDDDGDGTSGDLYWELFNVSTGALIHSQTVSATGTRTVGSTIVDNYVFADLATSIFLAAGGTYSVVAYGFDGTDKNFNTNFDLSTLDVDFSSLGIIGAGGRYGGAIGALPTSGAGNVASNQPYNFGAATFEYTAVPEPGTLALLGLGLVGMAARRRKTI